MENVETFFSAKQTTVYRTNYTTSARVAISFSGASVFTFCLSWIIINISVRNDRGILAKRKYALNLPRKPSEKNNLIIKDDIWIN